MQKMLIAALVAGQMLGQSAPAFAQAQETQAGAFGGFRIRLPFGGANRELVRAGLAFAPTVRTDYQDGRGRTRIGEGVEFGFAGRGPVQFSLAGIPVNRLAQGRTGPDGRRLGISTVAWIAIGVGVLAVATVVLFESCRAGDICGSDRDD